MTDEDERRKAIIDAAEADLLPNVLKYCTDCGGDGCPNCSDTGFEMARRARKYGVLSYSMGYKIEDLYKAFIAQYADNPDYKEAVDAITDALLELRNAPCNSCQGLGSVERSLPPVMGGGFESCVCPACKGTGKLAKTSESTAVMRRHPLKSRGRDRAEVIAFYQTIREAKKNAEGA